MIYDIGDKNVGEESANNIAGVLSKMTRLQELYLYNNNLGTAGMIKIAKALQDTSTLKVFSIGGNRIDEGAADDVAMILSNNAKLKEIYLHNNNFKTGGIIKIAKALENTSALTAFSIGDNNVGEGAADDIAAVLSHNFRLKEIYLHNNNFKTAGIMKIVKSLQNISGLTAFSIGDNSVGEEAADDIAAVLSHNTKLQQLHLHNNNFRTVGIIKIVKALQNIATLTVLSIGDNDIGEEAADDIATILSQNTKLQEVHLHNNSFKTAGVIKITEALKNTSGLAKYDISNNNIEERAISIIRSVLSWNVKLNLTI